MEGIGEGVGNGANQDQDTRTFSGIGVLKFKVSAWLYGLIGVLAGAGSPYSLKGTFGCGTPKVSGVEAAGVPAAGVAERPPAAAPSCPPGAARETSTLVATPSKAVLAPPTRRMPWGDPNAVTNAR
uniref:Uncharacterized protein n=1 Tax=Anopheles farauti TaxID=69004 RepID=A0A182QU27_9DIPT